MTLAHNFYGPKLKCYGLYFLFAKINLEQPEQPESETWSNQRAKRGPTRERNVEQPERDTWTNHSATRGQNLVRHVDHSELDTWTNRSATRGAVSKSHVIVSMSARALPRQQPAWAVPRGIPFRDQFCDHLPWS
jgi:hypothetical protein